MLNIPKDQASFILGIMERWLSAIRVKVVTTKKLTDKQEAFCLAYLECNNQSEAYRQAYDVGENTKAAGIHVDACKLMGSPNVALRVFELQQIAQERTLVTVESLTKELEEAREMAIKTNQPAAMTGASMGKAKLHGLDVQKIDLTGSMSVVIASSDEDL